MVGGFVRPSSPFCPAWSCTCTSAAGNVAGSRSGPACDRHMRACAPRQVCSHPDFETAPAPEIIAIAITHFTIDATDAAPAPAPTVSRV